ncbi:MAG TPA: HAMP domain-containing sensor histidine kinase [Longimicrobiaceae bacterium]|nr:HAMP domain-containing sensor histidine kinase [Longimicrobiaceae bacterium]
MESEAGRWFSVRLHPYRSADDRIDGVVATFYDITERKRLAIEADAAKELAQEANRVKGVFLATLSHEFRTPLNGMLGYVDLLLFEKDLSEVQIGRVERIKHGVWHLARMIDEILAFAKLDAGREDLAWEKVDARKIVEEAAELVEPGAHAKGLKFTMKLPDSAIEIETDSGKARQILVNLLGNAVRYTESGEVSFDLRLDDGDGDRAVFTVRDSGIGIANENQELVFDRFWQVRGGLTRTAGGTGLGLAAAREFSRLLGGDVLVSSELGKGSVFSLWLPVKLPSRSPVG